MDKRNNVFRQAIIVIALYLISVLLYLYEFFKYVLLFFLNTNSSVPTHSSPNTDPPLPASPAPSQVHFFMVLGQSGLIGYLLLTHSLHIEVELSAVTCFLEAEGYEAVMFVNLGSNSSPKAMQRIADITRKRGQLIEITWSMQY